MLLGGKIKEERKLAEEASPVYYVSENCPPFLIMHGGKDSLVPFSQSEILFNKLKEKKVEATLIKIKNAGHGIGFGRKAIKYVEVFFDYHLKGEKENWGKLTKNKNYLEINL